MSSSVENGRGWSCSDAMKAFESTCAPPLLRDELVDRVGDVHSFTRPSESTLYGVEALSPDRALFFGREGSVSSFGFVSMAQ